MLRLPQPPLPPLREPCRWARSASGRGHRRVPRVAAAGGAVPRCTGPAGSRGPQQVPSQPRTVTSANGLSQRLHCRPITPGLQGHCPVSMSQARVWEPDGKQSQG